MEKSADLMKIESAVVRDVAVEVVKGLKGDANGKLTVSDGGSPIDINVTGIIHRLECDAAEGKKGSPSVIVKVAPRHAIRRTEFLVRPFFTREIYVFNQILPAFETFEKSKLIKEDERFVQYPKCYKTIDSKLDECLILEDLVALNYSNVNRKTQLMTVQHCRVVLKSLARFHAISFAMKKQNKAEFEKLTSELNEVAFVEQNKQLTYFLNHRADLVKRGVQGEPMLRDRIANLYKDEGIDIVTRCINTANESVITFGDLHQNNILFQYDNAKVPIKTAFVDWQMVRQASPIIDVSFFLFSSTTKQLRDEHYAALLDFYHNELSEHIKRLGSDPLELFPRSVMDQHLTNYGKYGLLMSTVQIPMFYIAEDYVPDFEKIAENVSLNKFEDESTQLAYGADTQIEKRYRDIVDDMVRLNYI